MSDVSSPFRRKRILDLTTIFAFSLLLVWAGCSDALTPTGPETTEVHSRTGSANPEVQAAMKVQQRHTDDLLGKPGIVGTATGLTQDGNPTLVVYAVTATAAAQAKLPSHVEGLPVAVEVTGMFVAGSDPQTRQRPAPVGFSVGHPDITAGTIGARVKDGSGNVYILSNNHVLANVNDANIGDSALQPGPYDGGSDPDDKIGELYDFEVIDFSGTNTMDAAIASSSTSNLNFATPTDDAYGAPGTTPKSASVGLAVQKYGRTTGHTQGDVSEINVTVDVCYETAGPFRCKRAARFENQIGITPGDFSAGGDSGSLIVTDDTGKNPVGLLFAGSDTRTLANPIGPVLDRFNVSIDDGSGDNGGGTNNPPTASFTSSCTDLTCDFDASGSSDSDGSISSYDWVFGDGNTGTGQTVSHTYASGATYTVTLTVTDDDGATDRQSQDVTVNEPPTGDISVTGITPDNMTAGSSADVTISGSGFASGASVALENGSGPAPTVTVNSVSSNEITATITAKSGGPPRNRVWDVRVTNPDGSSDVLAGGFTITP